jgi:RHH-type proline utilization regulon transcriptional repressor/proline dehydrogenase/delta 1-pyrroline-5-carboxylate dehydrogenase
VGEANVYALEPKGPVLCIPATAFGLCTQIGAALATGNTPQLRAPEAVLAELPAELREKLPAETGATIAAVLHEGSQKAALEVLQEMADRTETGLIPVFTATAEALRTATDDYPLEFLVLERATSTNTAAAGGNAALMAIG